MRGKSYLVNSRIAACVVRGRALTSNTHLAYINSTFNEKLSPNL